MNYTHINQKPSLFQIYNYNLNFITNNEYH